MFPIVYTSTKQWGTSSKTTLIFNIPFLQECHYIKPSMLNPSQVTNVDCDMQIIKLTITEANLYNQVFVNAPINFYGYKWFAMGI